MSTIKQYKQATIGDKQLGELIKQRAAHLDATLEQHIRLWSQHQHDVAGDLTVHRRFAR